MKVSKTDNRFKTGFPKPITGLPKKQILTSLVSSLMMMVLCLQAGSLAFMPPGGMRWVRWFRFAFLRDNYGWATCPRSLQWLEIRTHDLWVSTELTPTRLRPNSFKLIHSEFYRKTVELTDQVSVCMSTDMLHDVYQNIFIRRKCCCSGFACRNIGPNYYKMTCAQFYNSVTERKLLLKAVKSILK